MIDSHCHLEQRDFDKDRDEIIEKSKKELKAVITCCAHPKDFNLTMQMVEKNKGFIFATVSIHPLYIKEITEREKDEFLDLIRKNKDRITALGEQGLDYFEIKESKWRQKQKELFIEFINLSKELNLPLVVHARDAFEDAIKILEQQDAKNVLMHMFGAYHLLKRVIENNWFISLNTIILRSKKHKKITRDVPLEKLLTETDSPWLDPAGGRNTPLNVKIVIEKISEIKKMPQNQVDEITTQNAIRFFNLHL
ncbi:MAG: TatD family hydrolase [Candidatus Aenigmarchaeota archaeon]|nr:TatD family hydrolase [Candidatus Aenigmarchaeota archaeon]